MLTIARLFGKSPFAPLQTHMKRVANCIEKLTDIFDALPKKDLERIEKLGKDLSELEHEADLTKNDIRNHLPKSLFLPIDRSHFLDILSIQDQIADKAEEIGILLSFKTLDMQEDFKEDLKELYQKSTETFWQSKKIIEELDELLESSFGGIGAEKVKSMVEHTAYLEHEVSQKQRKIMKRLLSQEIPLSTTAFYLWDHLIKELGTIAELSEGLANRIRMILELK
ncbi:MAG: TIGR00153 family protein [Verrucomicrobia bacterium]|nr:TIGR00153 family protein [Verrucomicrobiota bacterium]